MRTFFLLISMLWGGAAGAQTTAPCEWQVQPDAIPERWETNTRTFAQGAVRLALIDTIEPAAAAYYLMILHPPYDEVGGRSCTLVGHGEGYGYAFLSFPELTASYDPAQGLIFQLPAIIYLPEQNFQNSAYLTITLNQATGDVTVAQELGGE